MNFKLEKISAPAFDDEGYFVDLSITFDKRPDGSPNKTFGSICVELPMTQIETLTLEQIELMAIAAAKAELR